jgi:hypothetical protein
MAKNRRNGEITLCMATFCDDIYNNQRPPIGGLLVQSGKGTGFIPYNGRIDSNNAMIFQNLRTMIIGHAYNPNGHPIEVICANAKGIKSFKISQNESPLFKLPYATACLRSINTCFIERIYRALEIQGNKKPRIILITEKQKAKQ